MTTDEACAFFEELLGENWEEKLLISGALAGPEQVDTARDSALRLARQERPEIEWTAARYDMVSQAWLTLWVDMDREDMP